MSTTPEDPIARAIVARDHIQACREAMSRSRQERQAALIEARASMTVAEIAEALDLTPATVYAIMAGRR